MSLSTWRGALLAGCLAVTVAATGGWAQSPAQETEESSNLPRHVSIHDSRGRDWAELSYATDSTEYYRVYSPSTGGGGTLRSDTPRTWRLSGPESWSLRSSGKGFTLFNGGGYAVYRVERWNGIHGDTSGPLGTASGVYGDWKVLDMHNHPLYFVESLDHDYNVLDRNFHLLSVVKPASRGGGYVVMDKGNKTWWTVKGQGVGPLAASFMGIHGVSPWARLLMGSYFFPDWW